MYFATSGRSIAPSTQSPDGSVNAAPLPDPIPPIAAYARAGFRLDFTRDGRWRFSHRSRIPRHLVLIGTTTTPDGQVLVCEPVDSAIRATDRWAAVPAGVTGFAGADARARGRLSGAQAASRGTAWGGRSNHRTLHQQAWSSVFGVGTKG
jgi:hypothetical protein